MGKAVFALALVLAAPLLCALFLVGESQLGKPFPVLCEGQTSVFISEPDGKTEKLELDALFQAQFTPDAPGPYIVQCGNETKEILVQGAAQAQRVDDNGMEVASAFLLLSILAFMALMLAASVFIAKAYLGSSRFTKVVSNGSAQLFLKAQHRMESVQISDPVSTDHQGPALKFSIPRIEAGSQWHHEYAISSPLRTLPADLSASVNGKRISMLSELYIEGNIAGDTPPSGGKRRIPRASA